MTIALPPIKNKKLLQQALTHRSYINEHSEAREHNERLEFLGDAVLGFLVGELLYQRYQQMSEAQLTRLRAMLVDEKQLAHLAKKMDLGNLMLLGKGAEKDGAKESTAILCDTFEAVIGAYFLDAGIEAVHNYIQLLFTPVAETIVQAKSEENLKQLIDSKNLLQQWAITRLGENPHYRIINESGPDHAKLFTAEVRLQGKVYGVGQGRRKQEAEKQAAEEALHKLGVRG